MASFESIPCARTALVSPNKDLEPSVQQHNTAILSKTKDKSTDFHNRYNDPKDKEGNQNYELFDSCLESPTHFRPAPPYLPPKIFSRGKLLRTSPSPLNNPLRCNNRNEKTHDSSLTLNHSVRPRNAELLFSESANVVDYPSQLRTPFGFQPQLGTQYVEGVPVVLGIPTAVLHIRLHWVFLIGNLLFLGLSTFLFCRHATLLTMNIRYELPNYSNVTLHMKNCVTGIVRSSDDKAYIHMTAWLSRSEDLIKDSSINPLVWNTATDIVGTLKMQSYNLYFQCVAKLLVPENFVFDQLHIHYLPSESYMDITSDVSIKAKTRFSLKAFDAIAHFQSLDSPHIVLEIADGSLRFLLDGTDEAYNYIDKNALVVKSRTAPVTIESSVPVDITMSSGVAVRALIRGGGILVTDRQTGDNKQIVALAYSSKYRSPSFVIKSLSIQMIGEESPLYLTARKINEDVDQLRLTAWAGAEQIAPPHLVETYERRLWRISPWLDELPGSAFAVTISVLGERIPTGLWRFLSSSAFLGASNWFIIFSGGMLNPRTLRISIHVMGLYCRGSSIDDFEEQYSQITQATEIDYTDSEVKKRALTATNQTSLNTLTIHEKPAEQNTLKQLPITGTNKSVDKSNPGPCSNYTENQECNYNGILQNTYYDDIVGDKIDSFIHIDKYQSRRRLSAWNDDKHYTGKEIGIIRSNKECQRELLEDEFVVIWEALNKSRGPTNILVWADKIGNEIKFSINNDAVIRDPANWRDKSFFAVATVINLVCSTIASLVLSKLFLATFTKIFKIQFEQGMQIRHMASYRLDHEVSKSIGSGWNVNVTSTMAPYCGFLLRWSYTSMGFARIGIQIRPMKNVDDDRRPKADVNQLFSRSTTETDELFIYVPPTAVKTVETFSGYQRELRIPLTHPHYTTVNYPVDSSQKWQIDPNKKYRLRVLGVNHSGRVIKQSSWSLEVTVGNVPSISELPYSIAGRFIPANGSSLEFFMKKLVRHHSPFKCPAIIWRPRYFETFTYFLNTVTLEIFDNFYKTTLLKDPSQSASLMNRETNQKRSLIKPRNTNQTRRPEAKYVLAAYYGRTNRSNPSSRISDRAASGSIVIEGIPVPIENSGDNSSLLISDPRQSIFLEHESDSQSTLVLEISDGYTGNLVAQGFIRLEEIESTLLLPEHGGLADTVLNRFGLKPELHARIKHLQGGGQWGRVSCVLDLTALQPFIRHSPAPGSSLALCALSATPFSTFAQHEIQVEKNDITPLPSDRSLPLGFVALRQNQEALDITDAEREVTSTPQYILETRPTIVRFSSTPPDESSTPYYARKSRRTITQFSPTPCFVFDIPGKMHLEGSDLTIQWIWNYINKPDNVYLHLFDHETNQYLFPLQFGRTVSNTGTYSWSVIVPLEKGKSWRTCYFAMTLEPFTQQQNLPVVAQSHAFFIVKTLPLCELEMAYAAFCRAYFLEMEPMSEESLCEQGIQVIQRNIKICPDLRNPLPFESKVPCIHSPGQCIVSSASKLVVLKESDSSLFNEDANSTARPIMQVNVYKSVTQRIKIVEHCQLEQDPYWWTNSSDGLVTRESLTYFIHLFDQLDCISGKISLFIKRTKVRIKKLLFKLKVGFQGVEEEYQNSPTLLLHTSEKETEETFLRHRYFRFKLQPVAVGAVFIVLRLALFVVFPLQILGAVTLYNYIVNDFIQIPHRGIDHRFLSDVVFSNNPIQFVLHVHSPLREIIVIMILDIIFWFLEIFLIRPLKMELPRLNTITHTIAVIGQVVRTVITFWAISTFLLWFLVGALINSDAFLPYAVMLGACVFACYTVWGGYVGARAMIQKFIETHSENLTSLALDKWFNNTDMNYIDTPLTSIGPLAQSVHYRDQLRECLKFERMKARVTFQLGKENRLQSRQSNEHEDYIHARIKRESLCTWKYEKVGPPPLSPLEFDSNGIPQGIEAIKGLASGARLVTVHEAERHAGAISSLLVGFEIAMLEDGVKYGPRFGYKLERKVIPNQKFSFAIVALPRYPPPDILPDKTKVAMIFDAFNKDLDPYLNEVEFTLWQLVLHKAQPVDDDSWHNVIQLYFSKYRCEIDAEKGASIRDLEIYYEIAGVSELDNDYRHLFPILLDADQEGDTASSHLSDELSPAEDLEEEESIANESDGSYSASGESTDPEEEMAGNKSEFHGDEEDIEEQLRTSINARKLQFIFNHMTQENRGRRIDALISSAPYLANKITESQLHLLRPVFGEEGVFGFFELSCHALVTQQRKRLPPLPSFMNSNAGISTCSTQLVQPEPPETESRSGLLVIHLRNLHEEVVNELYQQFRAMYIHMFDPALVRDGVAQFYDSVVVDKIQMKASRLLNENIQVTASDVDPSTFEEFRVLPPKTVEQLCQFVQRWRVTHDAEIRRFLQLADQAPTLALDLQTSIVVKVLLAAQVLRETEVVHETVTPTTPGLSPTEVTLCLPRHKECHQVIARATESYRYQASDSTEEIIKQIGTNFLWFDAFRVLVRLLGISLSHDELPGSALPDTGNESNELYNVHATSRSQCSNRLSVQRKNLKKLVVDARFEAFSHLGERVAEARILEQKERYVRNCTRIRQVFDQLTNRSSFLPVDLADEAILLLTDNRMNFAAVVACLQYLKIHSPSVISDTGAEAALTSLGVVLESPVSDIDASTEEHVERFDWTEYRRRPGWDQRLAQTYNRLTWASPGFMGKSQMIEFIREIHKMFSPISSDPLRKLEGTGYTRGLLTNIPTTQVHSSLNLDFVYAGPSEPAVPEDTKSAMGRLVSFEMFHRVAIRTQFSLSRRHSRILWVLMCCQLCKVEGCADAIRQFLPVLDVCRLLPDLYFQSIDRQGFILPHTDPFGSVASYKGYLTQNLFRRLMRKVGIDISEKGLKAIWEELHKDPMDITDFLPTSLLLNSEEVEDAVQTKFLRLEMDKMGLDPTRGRVVSIQTFRSQICKILMSGLWPECIKVLMKLSLQLDFTNAQLESVLDKLIRRSNHFGLAKPEDLPTIMTSLNVEGMSFAMLKGIVERMQLRMSPTILRQMYNIMDVNHDGSLDLGELMNGFQVLFNKLLPLTVINAVKVAEEDQLTSILFSLIALCTFFGFIGIAFSSFVGVHNSGSTAMQSILALVGAISLQAGASHDSEKLSERLRMKMQGIFGDELEERLKEHPTQRDEKKAATKTSIQPTEQKPIRLRYFVPRKYRPDHQDPWPCLHFRPGDFIRLEPFCHRRFDRDRVRWSISPKLPSKLGLNFDTKTGIIVGRIRSRLLSLDFLLTEPSPKRKHKGSLAQLQSPLLVGGALGIQRRGTNGLDGVDTRQTQVSFPRTTFTIICRNSAGSAKTRVTFQIIPESRSIEAVSNTLQSTDDNNENSNIIEGLEDELDVDFHRRSTQKRDLSGPKEPSQKQASQQREERRNPRFGKRTSILLE